MRKSMIAIALLAATVSANQIATADSNSSPSTQSPSRSQATPPAKNQDDVHITVRAGRGRLGLGAIQISSELRKHLGAPADRGVLIDQVRPDSPAAKAGLQVGDVITDVDGAPCKTVDDIVQAMEESNVSRIICISSGAISIPPRSTIIGAYLRPPRLSAGTAGRSAGRAPASGRMMLSDPSANR